MRLLVAGRQEVFQGRTLPFEFHPQGRKAEIIARSRDRFGTSKVPAVVPLVSAIQAGS